MTDSDLAYAAGVIDGDGCIMIVETQRPANPVYRVTVDVSMSDAIVPYWFREMFGGRVNVKKTPHRPAYRWTMDCARAEEFLRGVLPYLKLKRPQAELALRLRGPVWGPRGTQRLPEDEVARRRVIKEQMGALNAREA